MEEGCSLGKLLGLPLGTALGVALGWMLGTALGKADIPEGDALEIPLGGEEKGMPSQVQGTRKSYEYFPPLTVGGLQILGSSRLPSVPNA
jgi:hypothetical protein